MVITTAKMLSHVIREFRYQGDLSQTDVAKLAGTTKPEFQRLRMIRSALSQKHCFKILAGLELELVVQPRKKSSDTALSIKEPTATYDDDEAW